MNTGQPIVASRAADHGIQDPDGLGRGIQVFGYSGVHGPDSSALNA